MVLEFIVVAAIGLALLFDFINGFHDSANAIATVVATRVLSPVQAVLMAGFFNFVGPFVFSLAVANTVGKGIIQTDAATVSVIIGALVGAIVWDLVTWWLALPTSSSHALVGGLIGAAWAASGLGSVLLPTGAEFASVAYELGLGAVGGLVVGLLMIPWSYVRLPRHFLLPLAVIGMLFMGYFSYTHTAYPAGAGLTIAGLRSLAKPVIVNFVFVLLGGLFGIILWAGTQRRMSPKTVPFFLIPGAAGNLAAATLLGTIKLGGITKTVVFMFVSPVLGFYMGFLMMAALQWLWRDTTADHVSRWSRRLQLGSSAFYALTHGTNDAQKTMGVIAVLLFGAATTAYVAGGSVGPPPEFHVPTWAIISSAVAMGLGTAFGGWRIVKTMAARITHLTPSQGLAAEAGGGVVLVAMAESGIPVSTTHAISSSIMGVGATKRASAVRWSVGRQMFIAWVLTIPASALVAAACYYVVSFVLTLV
jgi:inorganic phosphate transporter, PiT family